MTPKEKAKELVDKFSNEVLIDNYKSKRCALIAVDEIMQECDYWRGGTNDGWDTKRFDYWEQVKQEIQNL
jgi:hypothetical protein